MFLTFDCPKCAFFSITKLLSMFIRISPPLQPWYWCKLYLQNSCCCSICFLAHIKAVYWWKLYFNLGIELCTIKVVSLLLVGYWIVDTCFLDLIVALTSYRLLVVGKAPIERFVVLCLFWVKIGSGKVFTHLIYYFELLVVERLPSLFKI